MLSNVVFANIETSSIIISFSCASDIRNRVFFWSDIAGSVSPTSLGIAKAELMVVYSCNTCRSHRENCGHFWV